MSVPYLSFRPCSYHKGKDCFVYFYALNPETEKLQRVKVRVNHIRKTADRDRYARLLCHAIDEKLWAGWNPFAEALSAKALTVSQCVGKFLDDKSRTVRASSMKSYRSFCSILMKYLSDNHLDGKFCFQITREHLLRYMEYTDLNGPLTNKTYNNYVAFLYLLFDFFVERGYIKDNPAANLPKRRVDRKTRTVIPPSDRERIRLWFDERVPLYIYVMLLCYRLFIRPKEIMLLRIRNIDFDNSLLTIPSSVAKNHCDRILGVPDEIMGYFTTLRNLPEDWFIFSDPKTYAPGQRATAPTRIAEKWKEMRNALGLPESYQFYSLKDTGITEMLEAGVPAKYVQELADHHSLEMTERYTHKSSAKRILEFNKLEF
jgi:integrase